MENDIVRVRIVSLKDSSKRNLDNILCYIKKLTQLPTNDDESVIVETNNHVSPFVISIHETFDWHINEGNYCQILFLTAKTKSKAKADAFLEFNHLLNLIKDEKNKKQNQSEVSHNMVLQQGYHFEFSVQQVDSAMSVVSHSSMNSKNERYDKVSSRQPIRGHLMKLRQFNHPVHCAICHGFIWGFHRQGFQCTQCDIVTHKKCYQSIPFWCRRSMYPEPPPLNGNVRLKYDIEHTFKVQEAALVRAIIGRHHGHCNHCGAQIIRNALKCTQCNFIIHEHCLKNIPPMCTMPYSSMLEIVSSENIFGLTTRNHPSKGDVKVDERSISSSFSFSWLGPLPESDVFEEELEFLPKYEDFEYVGRLGDGAFAQVYCVQHTASQKYFAIKVADGKNEQARQQLEVERQILFRYSHGNPYMIKAYSTFHHGTNLFFVMELVEGGTLYHKIQTTRMNEDEIRFYLAELICTLQYLHANRIVYRDLKLEHAVVCSAGHIRLVDYGLGRLLKSDDETCHTFCGTLSYMAPEVRCLIKGQTEEGYSYSVDFWALGIMFLQMLCGEQLDSASQMFSNDNDEINEITNVEEYLKLFRFISPEARSCVIGLLENDPEKRLGSPKSPHGLIRNHPFFKVGHRIEWHEINAGSSRPLVKNPPVGPVLSDISIHQPLSTLMLDRGTHGKSGWINAGQSTCTPEEDKLYKKFDHVNRSWFQLIQSNNS